MKRLLMVLLVCGVCSVSAFAEIKFETQGWFDYNQTMTTNYSGYPVQYGGAFQISRFYVTLQGDIGKDWFGNGVKARFTMDLAKAQFNSSTVAVTNIVTPSVTNKTVTNISSVPVSSSIPVKFAYIDYYFLTAAGFKNEAVLSAGLIKSYFGNIADWSYPIPAKDATEVDGSVKPSASADFGAMLSGKLMASDDVPDGYFKYYLQVLNGEGYDKLINDASDQQVNNLAVQAAGYFMPVKGVSIGATYRMNPVVAMPTGVFTNTTTNNQTSYDILVAAKNLTIGDIKIPVDFLFQYIGLNQSQSVMGQTTNNVWNGSVISTMAGYGLMENTVTPYIRYDIVNQDDRNFATNVITANAKKYSEIYLGVNFMPTPNLQIKPFYALITAPGAKNDGYSYFYLQLDYKLNFSIWQ